MEREKTLSTTYAVPLIFVLAVVPLVALIAIYSTDIGENTWISGTAFYDFFLYYKSHLLMVIGLVLAAILVVSLRMGYYGNWQAKRTYAVLVPLGVFALMACLSAFLSSHRKDALFGGYEQFEGLFVMFAYFFCFLFTYLYVTNGEWVQTLVRALIVGSLILSLLGALQTVGVDYMTNKSMLPILTMFLKNVPDNFSITASFGEGVAYSTLYNPNYVGTYVALVLPVTVFGGIWEKNMVYRILAIASSVCQLIMLVGAGSFAGMIGVVASAGMAFVFLFADVRKNKKMLLAIASVFVVGLLTCVTVKPDLLRRFTETTISSCNYTVSAIETKGDTFIISLDNGQTLTAKTKSNSATYDLQWTDSAGKQVATKGEVSTGLVMADEKYSGLTFVAGKKELERKEKKQSYDTLRIQVTDTVYWDLLLLEGKWYYLNRIGKVDTLRKVTSYGFAHQYDLATNRGYIWSRTIPLLKETVFLGKGADNFVYAFPNDDYVGKINCGFDSQTVTKPHNMYMQIWVQDGMFACLALIFLYALLAVWTVRRCFVKGRLTVAQKLQIGIFCSLTGYMIAGIANDSTICVAPVFWALLGLGFALDAREKEKK